VALPQETEASLVSRAQQGDRSAYGELVRRYHQQVVGVVYRMCGDPHLADDAAQEAFIQAWLHLANYHPQTSLRNWLYRISVNAAIDSLRRQKPVVDIDDQQIISDVDDPEPALEQHERSEQVRKAVLMLSLASRSVLILREYEGLSYQEIADALDISIGTVMSRLNYARKRLLELLRPYLEEG
jgi:RNA polymerase sigma-70 factor (ECF subfamily)